MDGWDAGHSFIIIMGGGGKIPVLYTGLLLKADSFTCA